MSLAFTKAKSTCTFPSRLWGFAQHGDLITVGFDAHQVGQIIAIGLHAIPPLGRHVALLPCPVYVRIPGFAVVIASKARHHAERLDGLLRRESTTAPEMTKAGNV